MNPDRMLLKMRSSAALNLLSHGGLSTCINMTLNARQDTVGPDSLPVYDTTTAVDTNGVLFLDDYKYKLVAETMPSNCDACSLGYYPMRSGCNEQPKRTRFLDSVLIAVVVGCRSGAGNFSIKDALLDYGVDCVVSTNRRNHTAFMLFWCVNSWTNLGVTEPRVAARLAYNRALVQFRGLYGLESVGEVKARFTENGYPYIPNSWNDMIQVEGDVLVYPAKYGEIHE